MKKTIERITLIVASLIVLTLPAMAAETGMMKDNAGLAGKKDECLLVAKNCGASVDSIQERITRIQREIDRGRAVYTADELRKLREKLSEANREMESMITNDGA